MKYALDADDLIAAALQSFDRIVEGGNRSPGANTSGGLDLDLDAAVEEGEDSYLEVVGLDDRLAARAARQDELADELDIDFGDDDLGGVADGPAKAQAPVDTAAGAALALENAELRESEAQLQETLAALQAEHQTLQEAHQAQRKGAKDKTDGVRVMELKLRRKEEALGVLKMERDDLAGTLKMWEKMVTEMRNAARQVEEDQERIRRRHKKELGDIQLLANEKLFKKIIPALDNLELALNHSKVDGQHTAEQVIEGIRMTATHLFKSVEQAGLDRVQSRVGTPFDPAIHDAVERVEDVNQTSDTIAVCLSPGYSLRGRLIRPARVSVYYGGPSAPPPRPADGDDSGPD